MLSPRLSRRACEPEAAPRGHMRLFARVRSWLRASSRRADFEREMQDEMRVHLELYQAECQRELGPQHQACGTTSCDDYRMFTHALPHSLSADPATSGNAAAPRGSYRKPPSRYNLRVARSGDRQPLEPSSSPR